jgi:hypothetical protein
MQAQFPAARARAFQAVPAVDAYQTGGGAAAVLRHIGASGRRQGFRGLPRPAQKEPLVRLFQAPAAFAYLSRFAEADLPVGRYVHVPAVIVQVQR